MKEDVFDLLDKVSKKAFSVFNNLKYNRSLTNNISNYVVTTEMDKTDKETLSRNLSELKTVGLIRRVSCKFIPHKNDDKMKYHFIDFRRTYVINPEMIRCRDHDEAEYLWDYCGGKD
jgi:DNA-binding HxlR family transcriptional regulator